MIRAYNVLIERLKERNFAPKKQMLDNEISKEYEKAIRKQGLDVERVPKEAHRRNAAEKAIQTVKHHIKAVLAGCDKSFPLQLWERLLPQIELTCNLLRPANANPNISAYQYVFGNHDYNRMPLHPLGCAVQAYNDSNKRRSWEEHSKDGWYLGTSDKHYRSYDVYIKETKSKQNTDTVFFQHSYITKPKVTKADVVSEAATKLIDALKGNFAAAYDETQMEALERLAKVFSDATKKMSGIDLEAEATRPRVQNEAEAPRVNTEDESEPEIISVPRVQPTSTPEETEKKNNGPQLIPDDDDTVSTEDCSDDDSIEFDTIDPPRYNTRSQARTRDITREAILSAVEMSIEEMKPQRLAQRSYPLQVLCDIAAAVMDEDTGELLEYRQLMKHTKYKRVWGRAFGNEIGRLAQGMPGRVEGTNTFFFIPYSAIPTDRLKDVTYEEYAVMYDQRKSMNPIDAESQWEAIE